MSFLRNRLTRNIGLLVGVGAAMAGGLAARDARADVIVPVAAHLNGQQGSVWRSDEKVYNPTGQPVVVTISATPRGQTASGSDPSIVRTVAPGNTLLLEDVEYTIHGDGSWADRLRFHFTDTSNNVVANLPVKSTTYEQVAPGSEFGSFNTTFDPTADPVATPGDGYSLPGTILGTVLGKAAERDGLILNMGANGATILWTYNNGAGANTFTKTGTYGPDMTFQYTHGVPELLGFTPEANGSLTATIEAGSARVAVTHNNNATNCPSWDQMTIMPGSMSADDVAIQYVNHWLPRNDSKFYLSNHEIKAMINGGQGTRSYSHDMADILFNHSTPKPPGDVGMLEQALKDSVDGNFTNGEIYHGFDPLQWDNDAMGTSAVVFYFEPTGSNITEFKMDSQGMQLFYQLVKGLDGNGAPNGGFLTTFVKNNPDEYGGQLHGIPDMNFNPTWGSQDQN